MKIDKHELLAALEVVKPGLANTELIEQTSSFAFMGDRVVTYNDSISIAHPIEGMDLEGAVRAEELYEFLKRAKTKHVLLKVTDNELLLKSGNAKAGLRLEGKVTLPLSEVNKHKDWEDISTEFRENIKFVKDSCSSDMSRRVLTCVHASEHVIEASDGFQIMRVDRELEEEPLFPFDTLIPVENIPEIAKIEPAQAAISSGWVHFFNGKTELSCRILNDTYPPTDKHMDVEGEEVIFPKKMADILERVDVFTKKAHHLDEEMEVKLKKGRIQVLAKNENAWFEEEAKVKYNGEPVSFFITPYLLKNILGRSGTCTLGKEKIKFIGEDWQYTAVLRG